MRRIIFSIFYRYSLGSQLLQLINFCLFVVMTAKTLGFRAGPVLVIALPVAMFLVWLAGYFIDRFGQQQQNLEAINFERSPLAQEHFQITKWIYELLKKEGT